MMLSTLMRASLDGAIFVIVIWIVLRAVPRLSPATRTILWWCAAAKFVVALVWTSPVLVPVLPAESFRLQAEATRVEGTRDAAATANGQGAATASATPSGRATNPERDGSAGIRWSAAVLVSWAVGVLAAACVSLQRWRQIRDAVNASTRAHCSVQVMAGDLAARLGVRRLPDVRMSDRVTTPLVTGLWRPVVVLPASRFAALADRPQRLALCHELAHVKRIDLWLGCIPAVAERLFFFHPLAHLAAREYAFWREAACDADVLDALDAAPQEYGRLLLDLGASRHCRTLAAAGAPSSISNLKRRIVMLGAASTDRSTRSRLIAATVVALSALAVVPMQLAARPSFVDTAVLAPEHAPTVTAVSAPGEGQDQSTLNYVLFIDDTHTTMSGSRADIARASGHRRGRESLLWFRREGREYVVRDPAVLRQAEALWIPVNVLGDEQGRVGEQQGALGARQGELGAEQGRLGARQGVLGARQGILAAQEAHERATATQREAIERERRETEREMRELDREMRALGPKMRELDKPMQDLGEQMEALGKEMEAAVKQAEEQMRALLDRAIDTGAAELVR